MKATECMTALKMAKNQKVANAFAIAFALKISLNAMETITEDLMQFKLSTDGPREFTQKLSAYLESKHYSDTESVFFGWMMNEYIREIDIIKYGDQIDE